VMPYYAYGRSDKKDAPRVCITAKLLAKLIKTAGADRAIAIMLHSAQIHGFFDIPLDHLTSLWALAEHFRSQDLTDTVVVSPDVGFAKQASKLASPLGLPLAVGNKIRLGDAHVEIKTVLGSGGPAPRRAIVIDDEIATGGTMVEIVDAMQRLGTHCFTLACTHGLFTGNAIENMKKLDCVEQIVSTDTVTAPHAHEGFGDLLHIVSIASVLGEAIRRNHEGESIGELFTFWSGDMPSDKSLG
jgi:ribose-phosphate pyrophosphokinase